MISAAQYTDIGENRQRWAPGEWVFSSALHDVLEWKVDEYKGKFPHGDELFALTYTAHRLAPRFISQLADEICASPPEVLGLTSTFAQNVASLALAKAVKLRSPDTVIVMGGANCDGVMGPAMHSRYTFLDYVISGEGEDALVELLEALDGARGLGTVRNLSWRDPAFFSRSNEQRNDVAVARLPPPNFDDYFIQFEQCETAEHVEPSLVLESSRGCWWGAKHHCTFCGLNGTTMTFRTKAAADVMREIMLLTDRHKVLDIMMADNIIAMDSFKDLLPQLSSLDSDVRLHYEIKSNLTLEQIEQLRSAKVMHVQPGIESLSTHVLNLMEKGVTAAQNVYSLRELEQHNLTVSWNILAGFPGEDVSEYRKMLRAFPNLYHLQPPLGATRIMLQRFSPYFSKPWLGFQNKRPAECYEFIYGLSSSELTDMVYMFESDGLGVSDAIIHEIELEVEKWQAAYRDGARLTHTIDGDVVYIQDGRGKSEIEHILRGIEASIFAAVEEPSRVTGIRRRLETDGWNCDPHSLRRCLEDLCFRGLLFDDAGWYVRLSMNVRPHRIRHLDCEPLGLASRFDSISSKEVMP